jgi:hypothetical protein
VTNRSLDPSLDHSPTSSSNPWVEFRPGAVSNDVLAKFHVTPGFSRDRNAAAEHECMGFPFSDGATLHDGYHGWLDLRPPVILTLGIISGFGYCLLSPLRFECIDVWTKGGMCFGAPNHSKSSVEHKYLLISRLYMMTQDNTRPSGFVHSTLYSHNNRAGRVCIIVTSLHNSRLIYCIVTEHQLCGCQV